MNQDLAQYKDIFLQTAQEYVVSIEQGLNALRSSATDRTSIDSIHLAAHSLKSQNNALGFTSTAHAFMGIEHIFKSYQEHQSPVTSEVLEVTQSIVSRFKDTLESIRSGGTELDMSELVTKVQSVQNAL